MSSRWSQSERVQAEKRSRAAAKKGLKVRSHLKAGGIDIQHNRRLLVVAYARVIRRYARAFNRLGGR